MNEGPLKPKTKVNQFMQQVFQLPILNGNFLHLNLQGNFVGCLWMLMATLLFTIMIALIKQVGQTLNVFQIIFNSPSYNGIDYGPYNFKLFSNFV